MKFCLNMKMRSKVLIIIFLHLFILTVEASFKIQSLSGAKVSLPCKTSDWNPNEVLLVLWYKHNSEQPFYKVDARHRLLSKAKHTLADNELKERFYFDVSTTPPVLKISPVLLQDEGQYRCRVDYKKSRTKSVIISLVVIGPPKQVRITNTNGQNLEGIIGPFDEYSNVLLICEAIDGNPSPSLIWYHISVLEVIIDDSFTTSSNGIVRNELNLRKLDRNDFMSKLTCRASSNGLYEPIESSVFIDMNLKPLNVVILTPNKPLTAGESAQYRCRSDGSRPAAQITWVIGSESIDDVRNSIVNEGNTSLSTVSFIPLIEHDGKHLLCRAENQRMPNSTLEDKIVLNVQFSPQLEIHLNPNYHDISEGKETQIDCKISANPWVYEVSWFYEGNPVKLSEKSNMINSNQSLVLKNLNRNQSGKYQCIAGNSIGKTISEPLILSVKYAPVCKVGQKLFYTVIRNLVNKVKCLVESDPIENLKFKWIVNTSIETFELKSFDTNMTSSTANYNPKTIMSYALLLCYAENSIGIQREPCLYRLRIESGPPESVRYCDIINKSLTVLSVQCSAGNNGGLPQTFHLEVHKTKSEQLHSNHSSSQPIFIINKLVPKTHYKLVIYSTNSKGKSNSIAYEVMISSNEKQKVRAVRPLMNSLIGIVASIVIVCICIAIFIKIRSFIIGERSDEYYKNESQKSRLKLKIKDGTQDSDGDDETEERNLMKDEENTDTKSALSSSNTRLNSFRQLTNRLKFTKCKTVSLEGDKKYESVTTPKVTRKIVKFAEFDEFSEEKKQNSNEVLEVSGNKNTNEESQIEDSSATDSGQKPEAESTNFNKLDDKHS